MKVKSSGMLHLADCLRIADISEERAASNFRDSQYQNFLIFGEVGGAYVKNHFVPIASRLLVHELIRIASQNTAWIRLKDYSVITPVL